MDLDTELGFPQKFNVFLNDPKHLSDRFCENIWNQEKPGGQLKPNVAVTIMHKPHAKPHSNKQSSHRRMVNDDKSNTPACKTLEICCDCYLTHIQCLCRSSSWTSGPVHSGASCCAGSGCLASPSSMAQSC